MKHKKQLLRMQYGIIAGKDIIILLHLFVKTILVVF